MKTLALCPERKKDEKQKKKKENFYAFLTSRLKLLKVTSAMLYNSLETPKRHIHIYSYSLFSLLLPFFTSAARRRCTSTHIIILRVFYFSYISSSAFTRMRISV